MSNICEAVAYFFEDFDDEGDWADALDDYLILEGFDVCKGALGDRDLSAIVVIEEDDEKMVVYIANGSYGRDNKYRYALKNFEED